MIWDDDDFALMLWSIFNYFSSSYKSREIIKFASEKASVLGLVMFMAKYVTPLTPLSSHMCLCVRFPIFLLAFSLTPLTR